MTESRGDAVARAIDPLAWDELDKLDEAIIPSERLLSRIKASKQTANRAIEANDAWLKARGWKAVPQEATERMLVEGACCMPPTPENSISYSCWEPGNSTMREEASDDWRRMWNEAPSPEEPDK